MEKNIQDILNDQFIGTAFNRVDIVVRYLAIGNFYGDNDFGYDLYRKMYQMCFPKRKIDIINDRIDSFELLMGF